MYKSRTIANSQDMLAEIKKKGVITKERILAEKHLKHFQHLKAFRIVSMKCQFHFLSHVNHVGLQMYSDKFLNILSHEFKTFLQIFVFKGDTGQFFGEIRA